MIILKQFHFDAAHQLGANVPGDHKYARVHGHSFDVELQFKGIPDEATGWICDFAEIDGLIAKIQGQLDHQYLNDIEGLERPTLERIAIWIWDQVAAHQPMLHQVKIMRGSCREGCIYTGPNAT